MVSVVARLPQVLVPLDDLKTELVCQSCDVLVLLLRALQLIVG